MHHHIFEYKTPQVSEYSLDLKKPARIQNDDQELQQTNASVWCLLLKYDSYVAATCLSYIITPMVWSILNAVNIETKWFLFTNLQVWQGFDIDLTWFTIPENNRMMDGLFKYAKSVTIMADQLSVPYQIQTDLRLRWVQPGIYTYFPQSLWDCRPPIISDWPVMRNFKYEVCIWWDLSSPQFDIGIVDCKHAETIASSLQEAMLIVVHANLPQTIMWQVNKITVQSITAKKVLGMDSPGAFLGKEKAIVGIEVDETSIKFFWNRQHIDSVIVGGSFISKVVGDKFYLFMDPYSMDVQPVDGSLTTNHSM